MKVAHEETEIEEGNVGFTLGREIDNGMINRADKKESGLATLPYTGEKDQCHIGGERIAVECEEHRSG